MAHRTAPLVLFASATMLSLLACSLGPRSASADDELARDDEPTSRDQRVSGGVTRAAPVNVDEGAEPPTVLEGDDVDGDATPDAPTRVVTPDVKREPAEPVRRRPIEPVNVDERDEIEPPPIEPPPIEPPPVATGGDDVVGGVIDCGDSASWPAEWFRAEAEVVRLVNIERAARIGDEIGGHLLSGHIHGVAEVVDVSTPTNNHEVTMRVEPDVARFIFSKGYIALDGCSLTIVDVDRDASTFSVHLIPETLERTTFGHRGDGGRINVEVDAQTLAVVETVDATLAARGMG